MNRALEGSAPPDAHSALVDGFIDSWVSWRESCHDVHSAYARWRECGLAQRPLAFACHRAALDREELAAGVHADWAHRLNTQWPGTSVGHRR